MDSELVLTTEDIQVVLRGRIPFDGEETPYRVFYVQRQWKDSGVDFISDWHMLAVGGTRRQLPIAVWSEGLLVWVNPEAFGLGVDPNFILEVSRKIQAR